MRVAAARGPPAAAAAASSSTVAAAQRSSLELKEEELRAASRATGDACPAAATAAAAASAAGASFCALRSCRKSSDVWPAEIIDKAQGRRQEACKGGECVSGSGAGPALGWLQRAAASRTRLLFKGPQQPVPLLLVNVGAALRATRCAALLAARPCRNHRIIVHHAMPAAASHARGAGLRRASHAVQLPLARRGAARVAALARPAHCARRLRPRLGGAGVVRRPLPRVRLLSAPERLAARCARLQRPGLRLAARSCEQRTVATQGPSTRHPSTAALAQ